MTVLNVQMIHIAMGMQHRRMNQASQQEHQQMPHAIAVVNRAQ
jgi:hypothetical protein